MTTHTPPAYSETAPPPSDAAASVTPLPPLPQAAARHVLRSPYFVRSSVQNHLTSNFMFPVFATAFVDLSPAKTCSVFNVHPVAVVAVDKVETVEQRKIIRKNVPNTPSTYALVSAGTTVFTASFLARACSLSRDSVADLFRVVIPPSSIASSTETLSWPRDQRIAHDVDHSLCRVDELRFPEGKSDFVIKDTFTVSKCGLCSGEGYKPCRDCNASGKRVCSSCDGDGYVIKKETPKQTEKRVVKTRRIVKDADGRVRETEEVVEEVVQQASTSKSGGTRHACQNCNSTGRVKCSNCRSTGKRTCQDCEGHASILNYVCLRVTRLFRNSTMWFLKARNNSTGLYESSNSSYINLSSSSKSKIPTRVIWEGLEVDLDAALESAKTSITLPDRIIVPQVFIPDSNDSDLTSRIAAIDFRDIIDEAVPSRIAVGETEVRKAVDSRILFCEELSNGDENYAEKSLGRRVRIRQGAVYIVECEYYKGNQQNTGLDKGSFQVVFALKDVGRDGYVDEEDHTRWVIVDVIGYPLMKTYVQAGLWTLAGIATVGVLWGLFTIIKKHS
ncbi:UNVERIFIED_CONTAM: hypothetical protein HDU68_010249 [Siphonaria sp. JEL0065]|nr:hypothetical protein HDU68_010249 [Siphonaria sp. JEL0065]